MIDRETRCDICKCHLVRSNASDPYSHHACRFRLKSASLRQEIDELNDQSTKNGRARHAQRQETRVRNGRCTKD